LEPAGQNCAFLGGYQVGHDYAISKMSGVLGRRWSFHENYTFFRSGKHGSRGTTWKNCAISRDSAVIGSGFLSLMSA